SRGLREFRKAVCGDPVELRGWTLPDGFAAVRCGGTAAFPCSSWSESRGSCPRRSHRISVRSARHYRQLHARSRRDSAGEWLALCVSAGAGTEFLREPEPQLLRVFHTGPVEGHVETDIQLRITIRLRVRAFCTDGREPQGLSAARWTCVFTRQKDGHSFRVRNFRRSVCTVVSVHHISPASGRSAKRRPASESNRCRKRGVPTEPVSLHPRAGCADAGADCRQLFPERPGDLPCSSRY